MDQQQTDAVPDYSTMSSGERIAKINNYRTRLIGGETLTDEDLQDSLRLLRAERLSRASSPKGAKPAEPKKPTKMAAMLGDI